MNVLRMQRDVQGEHRIVLVLEGRIVNEWADALEEECLDLLVSGFRVSLDLSGVGFIGRKGVDALRRLGRAGIEIQGCSPSIVDLLEEEGIGVTRKREEMIDRILPWRRVRGFDA